jgi:predicted anti-sigma-YlaC factor YlaD
MRCETFRRQLEPYLGDTLEGDVRAAWRAHLGQCTECRRWAVAEEPTLLFAALPRPEPEPARVAACATAVNALIRHQRLERRLRTDRRPFLAAAAAVILMVTGALVWRSLSAPPMGTAAAPPTPAVVSATSETAPSLQPPPEVEVDMAGEGVRVYHFASDEDSNTAVLFIVNPAMES